MHFVLPDFGKNIPLYSLPSPQRQPAAAPVMAFLGLNLNDQFVFHWLKETRGVPIPI
jgi:hypothetical protein